MATLPFMFVFVLSLLFVNSEVQESDLRNSFENHDSEIAALLQHLNTSSFRVYNYKSATLLHVQTKADIAELVLDVDVECLNNYPEVPCNAKVLTCRGFVQNGTQVLNDVNCKPKPQIIIDEIPTIIPEDANETKTLVLSHEAASSEVSEPFIAVRKNLAPCLGCPFDLNPQVDGVDELVNLALEHVGSERDHKQGLVKVIRLQQQVVSGIKYILTVELGPTVCTKDANQELALCPLDSERDSTICEVTYLQKPWISKAKHIISNNCTVSQEYVKSDEKKNDISNEINGDKPKVEAPNFDHIAETGTMDESRLADLESQIIGIDEGPQNVAPVVTLVQNDAPSGSQTAATEVLISETTLTPEKLTANFEESSEEPKVKDSSKEQNPKTRKRRAIPQLEKISPDEKPLVKNLADFAASALDNIDDDNHKRVVLQILGAKKMVGDDGVYYHLIMRMGVSRCLEDKPNPYEDCREKLFENYTKICKVQVYVNDDFASPKVVKSQCQNIKRDKNDSNRTNYGRFRRQVGAPTEICIESDEIRALLNEGVGHLNRRRDGNRLKPVEVLSATTQVVAGTSTRIDVKLAESDCSKNDARELDDCRILKGAAPKRCELKIWEKSWENFRQFKIKCDDDRSYKIDTKIKPKREVLVGGPTQISVDREDVKTLLNLGVGHLNAQRGGKKVKPVEVVSVTSQVVAGSLFTINVKVAEADCGNDQELEKCKVVEGTSPQKCQIKVWEKSWQNFRQFEIKCEGDEQGYKIVTTIRTKRNVPGGQSPISVDSEDVKTLLNQGVGHLNAQRDGNKLKPVKVLSATSQVVAGSLISINVQLTESDCGKNDLKELEKCNLIKGASPKTCEIKVWEKTWENFRQFKIKCEGEDKDYKIETKIRQKREVALGGESPISVDREDVKTLLRQGVGHLNAQRGGNKVKPVEVLSATSQVVAGSLIRINVKIAESDCGKNDIRDLEKCNLLEGASPKTCEIKVWEKSWQNFRQFNIKCEGEDQDYEIETKIRDKRDVLLGGQSPISVDSEDVKTLLNQGVGHLNAQRNGNKLKPVKVLSATSQVVAGSLISINVQLTESDCDKNDLKELEKCNLLEGATPKTCEIKVWEKSWENFRQFNIKCEGESQDYKIETKMRQKREVLAGGQSPISVDREDVKALLKQGVGHLNAQRGGNKVKPVEVLSATSQVVAGSLIRINVKIAESDCGKNDIRDLEKCNLLEGASPKTCEIKVWEKSWQNFRQFNIKCEGEDQDYEIETKIRDKREVLPGGQSPITVDREDVKTLLNQGVGHLNAQRDGNKLKPVEVLSVTTQVVAGNLISINVKLTESDCGKNDLKELEKCNLLEGATPKTCEIKVWEKSWENFRQFKIKCEGEDRFYKVDTKIKPKRGAPGGEVQVSLDDDYVKKYLESGLEELDSQSDHQNKYKLHKVISATSQTVAGHIYRIKARVVLSNCAKTSPTERHQCGRLADSIPKTCNFVVFEQVWVPGSREVNVTCDDDAQTPGLLQKNDAKLFRSMFRSFIKKYNKNYTKDEYKHRFAVFSENMLKIRVLNTYEQGTAKYGVTPFADLTTVEFSRSRGYRPELRDENALPFAQAEIPNIEIPTEFDWRQKGVVTKVKDQQQCGSCWAFSVTGNIEGQYAIKHQKLLEFSEQELVDCDTEDQGCNGGLMDTAYRQIEKLGGLETEQEYPYDAEDEKCHFNKSLARVQLSGAVNISTDETDMAKWLVANGPISIAINANAMQFYFGGVSHPFKFLCNPKNLDHGVLIVGYGVHTYPLFNKTLPYWIVKNSWGPSWGEQGYYRVFRGDGTCGLNQTPSSAIVV